MDIKDLTSVIENDYWKVTLRDNVGTVLETNQILSVSKFEIVIDGNQFIIFQISESSNTQPRALNESNFTTYTITQLSNRYKITFYYFDEDLSAVKEVYFERYEE